MDLIMPAGELAESTIVYPARLQETNFQEEFIGPSRPSPPFSWFGFLYHQDNLHSTGIHRGNRKEGFERRILFKGPSLFPSQSMEVIRI